MERRLILAVAQPPGELDGPQARLDWLEAEMARLSQHVEGVDLLVLPELFVTGYNVGPKLLYWAEPADGPTARHIAGLAARFGIGVVYGYAETDGDSLYNAAQCFGADGTRLGGHRKLILPPNFEAELFTPGTQCRLFTFKGVLMATLICYDAEFPEIVRHVAAAGAELVLVPTALAARWDWVARCMIPTRAYENGVFLAYTNHSGQEGTLDYLGESCVVAPDGVELARAGAGPQTLVATLEPARIHAARQRLPYLKDRKRLVIDSWFTNEQAVCSVDDLEDDSERKALVINSNEKLGANRYQNKR